MHYSYRGSFTPRIITVQNTQASPDFLLLPQVIPTSIPIPIPKKNDPASILGRFGIDLGLIPNRFFFGIGIGVEVGMT